MTNIDRVIKEGFSKRDKFKKVADYMVHNYTVDLDDEGKTNLSADVALGMSVGEELTKKSYWLSGLIIGAGLGIGTTAYAWILSKEIGGSEEKNRYLAKIKTNNGKTTTVKVVGRNTFDVELKLDDHYGMDNYELLSVELE